MHLPNTFGQTGLHISYQASEAPQELTLHLRLNEQATDALVVDVVEDWVEAINRGGAGGALFAPEKGAAEILTDTDEIDPAGPDFSFLLSWAAVCPRFLRKVVQDTLTVAYEAKPVELSLVGTLPASGSSTSVSAHQLLHWLNDPSEYPATWPDLPFRVTQVGSPRGFTLRTFFTARLETEIVEEFEDLCRLWMEYLVAYPDRSGKTTGQFGPIAFAHGKQEIQFGVQPFTYSRVAFAPLLNMLGRFHLEHAAISEVEVGP